MTLFSFFFPFPQIGEKKEGENEGGKETREEKMGEGRKLDGGENGGGKETRRGENG